jgi:hypothetical protein
MTLASGAHGQPTGEAPQPILYHCRGARSFRALWMLEEVGARYTLELLPFPPRTRAPAFLDINPLGTIPALIIDGKLMTESAAITQFIATRFADGRFAVGQTDPCFGAYLTSERTLRLPSNERGSQIFAKPMAKGCADPLHRPSRSSGVSRLLTTSVPRYSHNRMGTATHRTELSCHPHLYLAKS